MFYNWKTAAVIRETAEALTIVFDTGNDHFEYKAGQFINITLTIDGNAVSRSYSLSSCPDEDELPAITVKRVSGGIISEYILSNAEGISSWQVDGPHGFFYPDERSLQAKSVILIGGGSGITPLYSMLKYFLKYTSLSVFLINTNRSGEDVIFYQDLRRLEHEYRARFAAWHVLSRQKGEGKSGFKNTMSGRLGKLTLKKLIKKLADDRLQESAFFVCGPMGLMTLSEQVITELEVSPQNFHKEYFSPPPEETKQVALPQETQEVLMHYYEQTNLLEVEPGKTILEAALKDKVPLTYSCRNGTCGTCIAKLTSGKVHLSTNFALREDHLAQGYILLCQSHPLDSEVTVEVGSLN